MIPFNIIVAVDAKNGVGKNGQLPWRLPGELRHFKDITTTIKDATKQNVVIMGRKTWDSLPEKYRPLPNRLNVVLTRNDQLALPLAVLKFKNLSEALLYVQKNQQQKKIESIFVIGGGEVFAEALQHPQCHKIFLTVIDHDFFCDIFLPKLKSDFKKVSESSIVQEEGLAYRFFEYSRQTL